jgi:hypothetical protein
MTPNHDPIVSLFLLIEYAALSTLLVMLWAKVLFDTSGRGISVTLRQFEGFRLDPGA